LSSRWTSCSGVRAEALACALILFGALTACAGSPAGERLGPGTAGALRELDRLTAALDTVRTDRQKQAWRADAGRLAERLGNLAFPEQGSTLVSETRHFLPALTALSDWSDPATPLPSAREFRQWAEPLKRTLTVGQRLATQSPSWENISEARIRLERVLRQRPYRQVLESAPGLLERIADLIYRYLLNPMFGAKGGAIRGWVIIICLVLLALLLAHMVWEVWLMYRGGRRGARGGLGAGGTGYPLSVFSGEDLMAQADAAGEGGKLVRDVGLYYLALIVWLAEAGCTRLDRTLTNWEHYRAARDSDRLGPETLRRLAEVNAFFDDHCYGGRPLSSDGAAQFRQKVLGLRSGLDVVAR